MVLVPESNAMKLANLMLPVVACMGWRGFSVTTYFLVTIYFSLEIYGEWRFCDISTISCSWPLLTLMYSIKCKAPCCFSSFKGILNYLIVKNTFTNILFDSSLLKVAVNLCETKTVKEVGDHLGTLECLYIFRLV